MDSRVTKALEAQLGEAVVCSRRLSGGDINDAYLVSLRSGVKRFVKTKSDAPHGMYSVEAKGLDWLRAANVLRIPAVIAVSEAGPRFLVLEYLDPASRTPDFDQRLGRGLALLHRSGAERFGWHEANFIGPLPQENTARQTWADFYREARLAKQIQLAVDSGRLSGSLRRRLDSLLDRMDDLVGDPEPPARLHGDLWAGNLHVGPAGEPCLIDPAVYGGHREMDLAMMQLFGGFGPAVFAAYDQEYPRAPGAAGRVPLYQLYPLLIHLNLFGAGYAGSVERAVSAYA